MRAVKSCREALRDAELHRRIGWVKEMQGLAIEALGADAAVGELFRIRLRGHARAGADGGGVLAEVVGLKQGRVVLMPYGPADGIAAGSEVHALGERSQLDVGPALLGRVVDGFGDPLDGGFRPATF